MRWQPANWVKLKMANCQSDRADCKCVECENFEAGASAMLESIAGLVGDDGYITFEKEEGEVVGVCIDD